MNVTENLEMNARVFFIPAKAKRNILYFSQETVRLL